MKISQAKLRSPSSKLDRATKSVLKKDVINVFNNDKKGEYYFLRTEQLIPFSNQARIYFDDEKISELSQTIKKHGMRQPLTVVRSSKNPGKYEIVSGERRYRAAKIINLEKIPCIVLTDQDNAEEIALIENIQREDLHPIELGRAYQKLYKSAFCKTHNDIAKKVSVPRSQITEFLSFAAIDDQIAELLIKHGVSDRKNLREVSAISDPYKQDLFIKTLFKDGLDRDVAKEKTSKLHKGIRKSNLIKLTLSDGDIEVFQKPLSKLNALEKTKLKEELLKLLEQL